MPDESRVKPQPFNLNPLLSEDAEARAELCRCGHTRGNHRWFAIGGKHPCYDENLGNRCECDSFVKPTDAKPQPLQPEAVTPEEIEYLRGEMAQTASPGDWAQYWMKRLIATIEEARRRPPSSLSSYESDCCRSAYDAGFDDAAFEARREQPVRVTDEMAKRMVVYEGHSPENTYAVKLAREKLEHALAAAPKEGEE